MAKILTVDDEQDIADVVKLVLELDGHEVKIETDPSEVAEVAIEWLPDLILLDVVMPHMDGYDVLKDIRTRSELKDIPVAFLTSKNKSVDFMMGLHMLKADDYITKPFGKKDLSERVQALLERHGVNE